MSCETQLHNHGEQLSEQCSGRPCGRPPTCLTCFQRQFNAISNLKTRTGQEEKRISTERMHERPEDTSIIIHRHTTREQPQQKIQRKQRRMDCHCCSRDRSRKGVLFIVGFILLSLVLQRKKTLLDPTFQSSGFSQGNIRAKSDPIPNNGTGASNTSNITADLASFAPVQELEKYISLHSESALRSEFSFSADNDKRNSNRKYAVAYYWCPRRSGNILHSFFNTVIWSMIHNRTVLWIYYNTSNQVEDCNEVLQAPWMPSYLEWQPRLGLDDPVPVSNTVHDGGFPQDDDRYPVVLYPQIPDVLQEQTSISRNAWSDHPFKTQAYQEYIQLLPADSQQLAFNLYSKGVNFLFGMLYSEIFQLQRPTTAASTSRTINGETSTSTFDPTTTDNDDSVWSLALHSRHTVAADDGSYVPHELQCLERLLGDEHAGSCRVHLMSDRPKTIQLLTQFLVHEKKCSVVTALHESNNGDDPIQEHGPWAGAGYLEDLDVTAWARDGIVGDPRRSSTALLIELMEYRRQMAAWKQDIQLDDELKLCKLPDKPPSGYDYGPGTPTFRHYPFLQPLAPIRVVVDEYIHRYINDAVSTSTSDDNDKPTTNGVVVVAMDFDRPTVEQIYGALNSFLFAIVTNMSLQWRKKKDPSEDHSSSCETGGSLAPKSWVSEKSDNGESLQVVTEIDFDDDNAGVFGLQEQNETTPILNSNTMLSLRFNQLRYNVSDWEIAIRNETNETIHLLADLYAHGQDVLYGLLFHELVSYCPSPSPVDQNPIPSASSILVLELDASLENAVGVQNCIDFVLLSSAQQLLDSNQDSTSSSCHVYILSDARSIDETVLASMVHRSEESSGQLHILVSRDQICSISFYHLSADESNKLSGTDDDHICTLPPTFWNQVQEAANARTGWIRPKDDSGLNDIVGAGAKLSRERLEYKRHWETWKLGREPFWISPLLECTY